jgi:hypothetical protein
VAASPVTLQGKFEPDDDNGLLSGFPNGTGFAMIMWARAPPEKRARRLTINAVSHMVYGLADSYVLRDGASKSVLAVR